MTPSSRAFAVACALLCANAALPGCKNDSATAPTAPAATPPTPTPAAPPVPPITQPVPNRPPLAVFRITPKLPRARPPLLVNINMCGSSDPDPGDELRFTAAWGDHQDSRGLCWLEHTYTRHGTYTAVACVSDRQPLPGHELCKSYTVTII